MQQTTVTAVSGAPQQYVHPQQPQQVIMTSSGASPRRTSYPGKASLVLGIILIILGLLSVLMNIVGLAIDAEAARVGHGFWCGAMFLITGILAVISGKTQNSGPIIGMMVMAILSCLITIGMISTSAAGLVIDREPNPWWEYNNQHYEASYYTTNRGGKMAVNATLLTCGILGFFLSLTMSILACVGLCSSNRAPGQVISTATYQPNAPNAMVVTHHQTSPYPQQQQPYPQQQQPMAYGGGPPPPQQQQQQPYGSAPPYEEKPPAYNQGPDPSQNKY